MTAGWATRAVGIDAPPPPPPETLAAKDGTRLDVQVAHAQGRHHDDDDATIVAVCLHPWGALGGTMRDPVVAALFRALLDGGPAPPTNAAGAPAACHTAARFNARGVGASESLPPGASLAARAAAALASPAQRNERDARDLVDVCAHALREAAAQEALSSRGGGGGSGDGITTPKRRRLWLIGYSHGSLVASRALPLLKARLPVIDPGAEIAGVVAVAPPLGLVCGLLLDAGRAFGPFARGGDDGVPRLAVLGTRDNFTSLDQLRAALGEQQEKEEPEEEKEEQQQRGGERGPGRGGEAPAKARLVLLEDADHFYWGRVGEVAGAVVAFVAEVEGERRLRRRGGITAE